LIDTSVLVDLGKIDPARLPDDFSISALTLAEVACGPHAATDDLERGRRQSHLQEVEANFEPLPFDAVCGRAFGQIYAAVAHIGRKARGARTVDLMIAATALANRIPLYTLNASDLKGLEGLIEIVDLR
jgi:predicted nucleic acid-binding protein